MQLWTQTTFLPSCKVPILMSMDCLMLSTACWHTNNQITTTSKCQHAPKKQIWKEHILWASIYKQEGGGGSVGHSSTASEVEPSLVPQSSISYMINIGTGISFTRFHTQPKNLRTMKCLFMTSPYLMSDHGRWKGAANRSRATMRTQ